MNQKGLDTWHIGGGLGYIVADYKTFFPQIRIFGAYHVMNASQSEQFKVATATVNAVADYILPFPLLDLHVLANIGYEYNMLTTKWIDSNIDLGVSRLRFSLAAQLGIFEFLKLNYEITITPNINHNIGVSAYF